MTIYEIQTSERERLWKSLDLSSRENLITSLVAYCRWLARVTGTRACDWSASWEAAHDIAYAVQEGRRLYGWEGTVKEVEREVQRRCK